MMNTPNKITLIRILMLPIIVFFYLADFIPYARLVAAILFVGACLTDFLDGYLARKNNQVTTLGKFFDTIADKMLIATGLILIVAVPVVGSDVAAFPNWLSVVCTIIILAREFIVSALRQLAASKGVVLAADMGGKIKATAQFVVVSLYMFLAFVETEFLTVKVTNAIAIIRFVLMILLVATTILTVYSGASYLIRNRKVFSDKENEKTEVKESVKEEEKVEEIVAHEGINNENLDPILPLALDIIIKENRASTTLIQRKLTIGYPRAARIIDQLEERGYISAPDVNTKERRINITKEEFIEKFGEEFKD